MVKCQYCKRETNLKSYCSEDCRKKAKISYLKYYNTNKDKRKKYRIKNKEKIAKLNKEYRQRPEIKIKLKEYDRQYLINNRDKFAINAKKYFESHKDIVRLRGRLYQQKSNQHKLWEQANREKSRLYQKIYKEKNKENCKIRDITYRKYGKAITCVVCGSNIRIEHHHYTFPYEIDRFIDLCVKCHHILNRKGFDIERLNLNNQLWLEISKKEAILKGNLDSL